MANIPAGPGFGSISDLGAGQGAFPPAPPPAGGFGPQGSMQGSPPPQGGMGAPPPQSFGGMQGAAPQGLGGMTNVQLGPLPQAPSQPFVGATVAPVTPRVPIAPAATPAAATPQSSLFGLGYNGSMPGFTPGSIGAAAAGNQPITSAQPGNPAMDHWAAMANYLRDNPSALGVYAQTQQDQAKWNQQGSGSPWQGMGSGNGGAAGNGSAGGQ